MPNNLFRVGSRRRILLVSENGVYPDYLGGMEIRARDLVSHLQGSYDVALLTKGSLAEPEGDATRPRTPGAASWAGAWTDGRVLRPVRSLRLVQSSRRRLKDIVSALQPDLLYLHKFCSLHPVVVHHLLHFGRPILGWFGDQHGAMLESFASGSWARRVALRIGPLEPRARDRVTLVFNCEHLRQFYAPLIQGYERQFVVYDGVDTRRFHPADALPDPARFCFLGRLDGGKGFLAFCRAMAAVPPELIGGIAIIGEGPQLAEGLDLLRLGGRSHLIREAGPCPPEAVPDRLRNASVLVHPSEEEGMPASVLEAMACGLAVIATSAGGSPEVVRHDDTGLLVAPRDFAGLVEACCRAGESAELRRRLGSNARALVAAHYDVSMSFAATQRLIEDAIDRSGVVAPSEDNGGQPGRIGAVG